MQEQYNPNQYQAAPPPYYQQQPVAPIVTTKEWLLTILLMIIPIVNIILMFVWAFSSSTNPSKANYFKAMLLWMAIILGVYIVFGVLIFGAIFSSL